MGNPRWSRTGVPITPCKVAQVWKRTPSPGRGRGALLLPDAKSRITVEYEAGQPVRAHTLLVSHQHVADARQEDLRDMIVRAWANVLPARGGLMIRPFSSTRRWWRRLFGNQPVKFIVDSYGGYARHLKGVFRPEYQTDRMTATQ